MSVESRSGGIDRSAPKGAVFLSYAREDTDAARRIAEALCSQGVEVWFDQSELRGGDAWDAKIRKQIRECALFLAVVSAHTQARSEGYFRREWKQAVERTHDMADGMPFLVPVVIDDTPESGASVPGQFLLVQWTRLPGALPTPEFVAQVRRLLVGKVSPIPIVGASLDDARGRRQAAPLRDKPAIPGWMWGVLAAVLGAVAIGILTLRQPEPTAAVVTKSKSLLTPTSTPAKEDKSIAVLLFKNNSEDKENAFFTDGIHEDILTNLAHIRELRVVSRTSVELYRDSKKTLRQIAQELGVAYVLEGSVQRAGGKVRVTGQLIRAATDEHLWAENYTRDLSDIFAIQTEIARAIAAELKATLSPAEKKMLERPLTTNATAYDLYLKAREFVDRSGANNLDGILRAEPLLQSAVELDPKFAAAWGKLAFVLVRHAALRRDPTGALASKAQGAIDTMERLAPDEPESLLQLVAFYSRSNSARADAYLQRAAVAAPGNGRVFMLLGDVEQREGRFAEALAHYRRACALDRQSPEIRNGLKAWLVRLRRYDDAATVEREDPNSDGYFLARLQFYARGSTREMEVWLAAHPDASRSAALYWTAYAGQTAEFVRICDEISRTGGTGALTNNEEGQLPFALMALGETARARDLAAKYVAAERSAGVTGTRLISINLALLGEKQAALENLEIYLAGVREHALGIDLSGTPTGKAVVLAWVGEKDQAVAELARLLKLPSILTVHSLRRGAYWKPLQGYSPFEVLLNDPKNNEPIL